MKDTRTDLEKQAWKEWEKVNKELDRSGGVNPHAFILGFKYVAKYDPCKLPEGQTDKTEPFQSWEPPKIRFVDPTNVHLHEASGLLNADEEHTGEEVQNSRGFYKRMTIEEAKEKGFVEMTPEQIDEVKIFMDGQHDRDKETYWKFLEMIHHTAPEVLKEFLTEHYGK